MRYTADLHIHSHYSLATSSKLTPEHLEYWARLKGIQVVATGDCIHPGWLNELQEKLLPAGNGFYVLQDKYRLAESRALTSDYFDFPVYFVLSTEISSIYKKNNRTRKIHNLCYFPSIEIAREVQDKLDRIGNIRADGRPILGLDAEKLLELVLESSSESYLIPAHIWTPWFSLFGSKSGFDVIDECFGPLSKEIFALETGLSSDPEMNRYCSMLDRFKLVSNSDAHSPEKLGREANLFDADLSYYGMFNSLKGESGFAGTIEFFPQEGKYHYDGHRNCGICWEPSETVKHKGICPVCGKEITKGVMYRVSELSDRKEVSRESVTPPFSSITPLVEIIAEYRMVQSTSNKKVVQDYHSIISQLGPEFDVLLHRSIDDIRSVAGEVLAEGISRLRSGKVFIEEGYDGEYGRIRVFGKDEFFTGNPLFAGLDLKEKKNKTSKIKISEIPESDIIEKNEIFRINEFTAEQLEAINFMDGQAAIIAGPGSGKTSVLIERIKKLINKGISSDEILAITFSQQGAAEIRKRLLRDNLPPVTVSTFHALGLKILQEHFQLIDRTGEFTLAEEHELGEILKSIQLNDSVKADIMLDDIFAYKEGWGNFDSVKDIFDEYESELQKNDIVDMSDLIYKSVQLLSNNPSVKEKWNKKFRWIMVDEFQDINARQSELIKLLTGDNGNLFVIGDPDQAIYAFRGSDENCFTKLVNDFSNIKMIQLKKSFRCTQMILDAAVGVFGKRDSMVALQIGENVAYQHYDTDRQESEWIARTIESLLGGVRHFSMDSGITDGNDNNISFSDFAILCRASFMFAPIIKALNDHGLPYEVIGGKPFYTESPVAEIIELIRAAYYKHDYSDMEKLATVASLIEQGKNISEIFLELSDIFKLDKKTAKRLYVWSAQFENNYDDFFKQLIISNKAGDDNQRVGEAIRLMTIHAAKGLEFSQVFVPGCDDGIIPFNIWKSENININEEARLLYVAMTRAKRKLYLSGASSRRCNNRKMKFEISPFLMKIDKGLITLPEFKLKGKADKIPEDQLKLF